MREIILDTETTGISPEEGHRIIEIGAIEVINRLPTGRTFHKYINPERDIDASAIRVHGITNEKVAGMPLFTDLMAELLTFLQDSPIVAHNASFDMGFLNHELRLADQPPLNNEVVDTLKIARKKFPGAQVSLDALCRRYEVDLSSRTLHGALLDAELLANVYLELTGGQQPVLGFSTEESTSKTGITYKQTNARPPRNFAPSADELNAHEAFIETIEENIWSAPHATQNT